MRSAPKIRVRQGDILKTDCDAIALKYAQDFYGADAAVVRRLRESGVEPDTLCPAVGSYVLRGSNGAVQAKDVLFVGVPSIESFSYQDIRGLSASVLRILQKERPQTRSVAMTIHGRGFGLDEIECVQQQILGYRDSFAQSHFPQGLNEILIIERDLVHVETIEQVVSECLATDDNRPSEPKEAVQGAEGGRSYSIPRQFLRVTPASTVEKAKIFVAIPFSTEMRDIWTFGIQQPIRNLGLVCERLDEESFLGDILTQITRRIESASIVIADLTGCNPNVFLEVGYAWGKGRPTILLFRTPKKGRNEQKLPFDVGGQRCIFYEDATHLHEQLAGELVKLGFAE